MSGLSLLLQTEATLGDLVVGLERPLALVAIPVVLAALWWLVLRGEGTASTRSRRLVFASRVLVAVLLVTAAAGPYTVVTRETTGDPRVTLLADRSDSMQVNQNVTDRLATNIEEQGVPVTVATIADGTQSPIGDGVAANLQENGSVVLVSDGQVTQGRSLGSAADLASSLNASVSTVDLETREPERYVTVSGPAKAAAGVESTFLVRVDGTELDENSQLTVTADGEEVLSREVNGSGSVDFSYTFQSVGSHRITATVSGPDTFEQNNVYRKTVRVVQRPKILYVSRGSYPLRNYLSSLYDVEQAQTIPENLDEYYAVVIQDQAAQDIGNVDTLQRFVIDGNGLVVVGGDNSFENGGYEGSSIASMLPVTFGEASAGSATVVLAIDISGSAESGMRLQKSIALDALNQLGDENTVGIVAFNYQAYSVAEPQPLAENRGFLEDRIRRLESGGATSISAGLRGAEEMLGGEQGTVILLSDGQDSVGEAATAANQLGSRGTRVITIGAGRSVDERTLQRIASQSGGTYFRATETDRLRLFFGGSSRRFEGEGLTIVDPNSFITSGVTLESSPSSANDVAIRRGADFLVATSDGTPAVASWRYGLGRVATITAYGSDGTLDGLLEQPDSLLVTKTVNYAIGDPERKSEGVTDVSDTRVGESTTVVFRGRERPQSDAVDFRQTSTGVYQATLTPNETGFNQVLDATYAVNYQSEYGSFGQTGELRSVVQTTGGRQFEPSQAAEIAEFARQESTRVRTLEQSWTWLALLLALLLYFGEIVLRRLQVYRGRSRSESGLT
ncbi:magnesium chelatase [Salinigranum rubrum]|uniref:Magnesium chelatase n=1 Tax=Salinigranum rubrum TaxID=755307 RepID=A0A2I8VI45_9EURY|nr:VWA domain-containing protein [Salinigranum rubrum]AUV81607.1 magnesium chelatase [Salinigranum rubrum]